MKHSQNAERLERLKLLERLERESLPSDSLEEPFLFQFVERALIDIFDRIHIDLGISLRHHIERIADALRRDPGRERKTGRDVLVSFFDRFGILLLQSLG